MSLKSIRESYSKLLTVFNDAGIKLTESQKADLDTFILALESTMSEQRQDAIRKTKRAVESKLDREYSKQFKNLMESMTQNQMLAAKVQNAVTKLTESKKIAKKVDDYLDLYVESVLPKKTIVDYEKMQKLERIQESLQDLLLVNDDSIAKKKEKLDESFKQQRSKCETEVAKMQVKLNESMAKTRELKRKLDQFKALDLLESKTKDLPSFEANQVKKRLAEATAPEIERNFNKVLEAVKNEASIAAEDAETTLEQEIDKIVDSEDSMMEDDMLKDRNHNGHVSMSENEEFETQESVNINSEGNIELDESEVIDPNLMKLWMNSSMAIR